MIKCGLTYCSDGNASGHNGAEFSECGRPRGHEGPVGDVPGTTCRRSPTRADLEVADPLIRTVEELLFYIQDKRSIVGNCVMWWRANGQGYTTELNEAGLYPATKKLRETDVLVSKELAESLAVKHVRAERLSDALAALAKKEHGAPAPW